MTQNSEELRIKKINYGIDLGTTTSLISHCEGNDTPIVPNLRSGRNFTPSAVAIDEEGNIEVGESAKNQFFLDKDNAEAEFKYKMGMNYRKTFKDSGIEMIPEELSAEVLKELKNSVFKQLGDDIHSAVITVPADFSPVKIEATKRAAELAGFKFNPIIMEPVAAAITYSNYLEDNGIWMIYDFGGGTFDVSVIKVENDDFINISHSGDEYLGGNLIDWDIVNKIFAKKISEDLGLNDFTSENYKKAFAKLKSAAEEGKKDLSVSDKAKIFVDSLLVHDNEIYDFKYTLTKNELEEIMTPYVKKTINNCKDALRKGKLTEEDIDYLILVGGSTISPIVRKCIKESFNIPLKYSLDPTTVVAKGAALFAGNIPDIPGEIIKDKFGLKLDYNGTGPIDEKFYVTGEILSNKVEDFEGFTIEAINTKTKRGTGKVSVEKNGFFEFELNPEDKENVYTINLYDPTDSLVEIDENSANAIEYKEGISNHKIILPHTLGLGLADDTLFILAQEGSILPYHNMEPFKTNADVIQGDEDSYISIPLYNGTAKVASNNTKVGELNITGDEVKKSILKNSEITITVDINESRNMKFDVFVLDTGEKFPFEINKEEEVVDPIIIKKKFIEAKNKYENIKLKCQYEIIPEEIEAYLKQIEEENIIENIIDFLERAESDDAAIYQADKLIKKLNEILMNISRFFDKKDNISSIVNMRKYVRKTVEEKGSYEDKEIFEQISNQIDEAIENEDYIKIHQFENILNEIDTKLIDPCERNKEVLVYYIYSAKYDDEDQELANDLIEEGKKALLDEDCSRIYQIALQLQKLLKRDDEEIPAISRGILRL